MKKIILLIMGIIVIVGSAGAQQHNHSHSHGKVQAKGYAAMDDKGLLIPYEFERRAVGGNDLLVELEYCGICHSDVHDVFNDWGISSYPNIPGHEMIGKVVETGKNVTLFKVGDHVGLGAVVISCGECEKCKAGEEQYCTNPQTDEHGNMVSVAGYSNKTVVNEHFAIRIPDGAPLEKLGPIMCAGITVYSPLKALNIKQGDKLAVAGFGGLGHLAVQYAKAFGADVTVFDLTEDKRALAAELGAERYINVNNPTEMDNLGGSFDYIISTISSHYDVNQYLGMLKTHGEMVIVGLPARSEAPSVNILEMPFGTKISKWLMGGIPQTQEVMDFSVRNGIYPMVEVIPVQQVNEAIKNVKEGKVHFRYVIDLKTIK